MRNEPKSDLERLSRLGLKIAGAPLAVLATLFVALLCAPNLAAWDVDTSASSADLEAFHEAFSFAAYPFAGHGASPLGVLGFEVYASVGIDQEFENEPFVAQVVDGSLPGDLLAVTRIGVRKGLPGGFDLGASYSRALDSDLEFGTVDLQWALIEGGALTPAVGLRGTYTQSLGGDGYDATTYGIEAMVSKGFTVIGVYGGVGAMRSEGEFDRSEFGLSRVDASHSQAFAFAGVTLNLLLPKFNLELQQGDRFQGSIRVAFGF